MFSDSESDNFRPVPNTSRIERVSISSVELNASEFNSDKSDINWNSGSESCSPAPSE